MKVAQVTCAYSPYKSGIGNVARSYHDIAINAGYKSEVFCPNYDRSAKKELNINRIKPLLKSGNGAFLPQLSYCLRSYDIVHLHYPFFGGAEVVFFAKKILQQKFKLVIHFHMGVGGLGGVKNILKLPNCLSRPYLWGVASAITCASLDYVKNLESQKALYKKYKEKYVEIPFSVDTAYFQPKREEENGILKILFVGGMDQAHHFKGVPVLLHALSKIKDLKWTLELVGAGDLKKEYEALSFKLGLSNKVKFFGGISNDELKKVYQRNSLLILPSINQNEAFGVVLLEGMASGLALIASRLPGVRTVFDDSVDGFYVTPNDVNDLSEKIKTLIENPDRLNKMSESARSKALNKYSNKVVSKKIIAFYENLLNK